MSTRPPLPERLPVVLDSATRTFAGGRVLAHRRSGRILRLSAEGRAAMPALLSGTATSDDVRRLGRHLLDAGLAHPLPPDMARPTDVTVVIPVRDRPAALATLLHALDGEHPVLVVDDGSTDRRAVAELCAINGARLVTRPHSGGPAAARNTALPHVESSLLAFIDSDCVPPAGWLADLTRHFADPVVGAVAPRIRPTAGGATRALDGYAAARCPLDLGPNPAAVGPGRCVAYVPSAALIFRRAAFPDGFDPKLRTGEDVDAVWRLIDAGWTVRYDPSVVVRHTEPSTWRALLMRRARYGMSVGPLETRHPGRLISAVVHPWPVAAGFALTTGHRGVAGVCLGVIIARSVRSAGAVGVPAPVAVSWATQSAGGALTSLGRAGTQIAAPVLLAGLKCRRSRATAAALLLGPAGTQWFARRPALDPVRWTLATIADDIAYGIGVWVGCARTRSLSALRPGTGATLRRVRDGGRPGDVGAPLPRPGSGSGYSPRATSTRRAPGQPAQDLKQGLQPWPPPLR